MKHTAVTSKTLRMRARYTQAIENHSSRIGGKIVFMFICFLCLFLASKGQQYKGHFFNNVNEQGVILDGYDPVAFFTDGKPVKGEMQFQYRYEDAVYFFADAEHLELFKANPEKYKPQFGGWCAYAVSLGRIAPIDVNTFSIVNDRLVIQHNQRAVAGWNKDVAANLALADKYWPAVAEKGGKQITTDAEKGFLNNLDNEGVILQGYDPVAYFTEMKAVKGDPKFTARYNGATYWFATEANATMFKDHPAMFAPQYGSFCGYAMSLGKLRPVDPLIFDVIEGRLILQHTKDAYDRFHKDIADNISKADDNWPKQVKKHAGKKVKFDKAATPAPEQVK